ncbi:MAG: amidase, partial [Actinomycetota bacterium]|nr:amidase [Actinomycetota bacterium]
MPDEALLQKISDACDLIREKDPQIHAFLPEAERCERLQKETQKLISRYPGQKPLLYGLSVGVKDLYNVEGMPTRAGSQLPASAFAGEEASLLTMLKTLGALIIGKTVSTEFAYFQPGETRNPLNPDHSPGGSSSGSAAAVAAGMCEFALGTQTIASVIRPAAFCGIVGFKPSYGLFPMDGIFPFSQSADHPGFFSQDMDTMIRVMTAILPGWRDERTHLPVLGIPSASFLDQADPEARAAFDAFIRTSIDEGMSVIQNDLFEDIQDINALHQDLISREFYLNHQSLFSSYGSLYSKASRELYLKGEGITDFAADQAKTARKHHRHELSRIMRQ